jgi:hypothetical protein
MNFRRTRNQRHVHGCDPPRNVTDRIDRSKPPWGGREERELDFLSKERICYSGKAMTGRILLQSGPPSPFVHAYDDTLFD